MTDDSYRTVGVYVSESVFRDIETELYAAAGCKDLETYFDATTSHVPRGDPVADVLSPWVADIVTSFDELYDAAEFDTANQLDPDAFQLLTLTSDGRTAYELRDLFDAAALIQKCDRRVVHTAVIEAAKQSRSFTDTTRGTRQ